MEVRIAFEELLARVRDDRAGGAAGAAAVELLQRHQAAAGAGERVIALRRLDHVGLRVADLDEATRALGAPVRADRASRPPGVLSCDDEPYCARADRGRRARASTTSPSELRARLARSTPRAHLDGARRRARAAGEHLELADPDGNAVQLLPYREPASRLVAHARPAGRLPVGHPRKLGHVNFLTGRIDEQVALLRRRARDEVTDWLGDAGVWLPHRLRHHVMALVDKGYRHFHHLAFDVVDIGQMRVALDHLGRHGRWLGWGPARHGVGGNIASYVRIVEEECFVELYCDMEQLAPDHEPRVWPDDRYSSNTWGPLPPRSYFRFDEAAVESERDSLEMQGVPLPMSAAGLHRSRARRRAGAAWCPPPPWHYVGDFLVIDYWADPDAVAVAAARGPGAASRPGRCAAVFADWQSCSEGGDELLDPVAVAVQGVLHRRQRAARRRGGHDLPVHLGRPATSRSRAAGSRASRRSSARSG